MYLLDYDGEPLHDPRDPLARASEASCDMEANSAGTLRLTIQPSHPLYGRLAAMSAEHEVVLAQADPDGTALAELWRGRVTDAGDDVRGEREVTCEGQLAYLADSVVRPYGTHADDAGEGEEPQWTTIAPDTRRGYAEWLVERHNDQVGPDKRFRIGVDELADEPCTRSSTQWPDTLSELKDKVLSAWGYFARPYVLGGVRYLDLLLDGGGDADQRVEMGSNLTDYATQSKLSDVYTAIIPAGKTAKDADGKGGGTAFGVSAYPDGPVPGHDGCSVQGDRVLSDEGVSRYGLVERRSSYDAETLDGLVGAACDDLAASHDEVESLTVSAVDLSHVDPSAAPIRLLDWVRVTSAPHGIDRRVLCLKASIDVCDPTRTTYTLGATLPTLADSSVIRAREQREQIADVVERVAPISAEAKAAARAASAAQVTADSKRRTFTTEPTPPYDEGDLWADTQTGVTYVCVRAKGE